MRKLINGNFVKEYSKAIDLTIHTKAPEKWMLIDMETGQKYIGSPEINKYGCWNRIEMKNENCFYCNKIAIFNQPSMETGEYLSVCKEHFIMAMPS